jgi:hypothetical protein
MYVWLWRHLPGPAAVRVLQLLVLASAAVAALMLYVFPEVEPLMPFQDVTVEPTTSGSPSP